MYIKDFVIPLNREDLLKSSNPGQFYVQEEHTVEEIREGLETAKTALNEEGVDFIVDHFSTYFSLVQKFKQCPQMVREKGLKSIKKAFDLLSRNLQVLFEDIQSIDPEIQYKMCNVTKMIVYILIELMKMYQDQYVDQNSKSLDGKVKKKQVQNKLANDEWDWNKEKHAILVDIHAFLQFPFKFLWEPPVVDEDFINMIANFCYKCLEDPGIGSPSTKYIRETMFQILGTLIKNYLHGLSFCVKVVQLLKMNDHLVNALAQGVIHIVQVCNCSNIVKEIVREVADTDGDQLAADTAGTRNLNLFLVQLSESIPEAIIPAIDLLISHLSGDSYSMRICVVGVLGEIVLSVLTKENLDDNMKKMRDEYLNCLEEHVHDVNAFVRTKVLQIWQKLCMAKAIPLSRITRLLKLVIGRLNDKSTNVKKQAVHLVKDMLEGNPFCGQLNINEIQSQVQIEKKKLESIENDYNLNSNDSEWEEAEKILKDLLEKMDDDDDDNGGGDVEKNGMDIEDSSLEEMINTVGSYLNKKEYKKAVGLILKLKSQFYKVYNVEQETCSSEALIEILQKIYKQNKKLSLLNVPTEIQEEMEKLQMTIEYLENALEFSKLIDCALPIILTFLDSNVTTDVLEAISFFSAAYLFGFNQALEGVRKMLYLVFSKESNIKSAVSSAYKDIYFQTSGTGRQQTMTTVKNLSELVLKLNYSQLDALEEVVKEWVKAEIIDKNCVQVMFERFSMKIPGTGIDQCWAALVLIRMVGAQESKIIKNNITVLLNEGLRNQGSKNFLIAKETCKAFQYLLPAKEQGKSFDHTLRYSRDHEIFKALYNLLKTGIWRVNDPYYIPMADEAINLLFAVCDQPDEFCKDLIVDVHQSIVSGKQPVEKICPSNGKIFNTKTNGDLLLDDLEKDEIPESVEKLEGDESSQTAGTSSELFIKLLTRFISILGQVASNYIIYLEGPVLDEFKLRNQLEYERKLKKFEESKKFNLSVRKNRRAVNDSGAEKNLNDTGTEDLEFNRVAADDMDTEEMRKKTESKIVTGNGFLAKFTPLILTICKNPGKYNNKALQNAALMTLAKFMQVSSVFCEENLQLLVTICEKSQTAERQVNVIIALGALQYRFPNSLEPWTPHMYATLQNQTPLVRYNSILILTDLIVNEMIKVRSHISNLAICIVDEDVKIARVARHFFREYSQKGNSLYNVLPSLISNLTQCNSPLSPEEFKIVMKYILALVTKEKQSEYLVEKLCQYFESATLERQWCDLAYCLSLLNYSDKGLKKILDNVKCFANKLYLADVYEAFCSIISDAVKNPQKDKVLINELQSIVKEYRDKSCEDKSICPVVKKQCPPSTKKKVQRKKYLPSDSEEEEFERRANQRKRKNGFESKKEDTDEDNDDENNVTFPSEASSKKRETIKRENDMTETSETDEFERKVSGKRTAVSSQRKHNTRTYKESSEEEDEEVKVRPSRQCKKRKCKKF